MFDLVGRSIKIVGDHPHTGETCLVARMEDTPVGYGLVIKLDDCVHGAQECFVFSPRNIKLIGLRFRKEFYS